MSEEKNQPAAPGRSWRNIRQEVAPRAMSSKGRRRRYLAAFRFSAALALVALAAWGVYALAHAWDGSRAGLATAVKGEALRFVKVESDGVLTDEAWVRSTLAIPPKTPLLDLDLAALSAKLTAHRQVRLAVLTRRFPDTLLVSLRERTPVARVQVDDGRGQRQMLVAPDGVVYDGHGYDATMIAQLPWLAGFRLHRAATGGLEPIEGLDAVSALLTTAQIQAPWLYREWQVVYLDRLADRDEILVKSTRVPEILFSRREDFTRQIAQLDLVMDTYNDAVRRQGIPPAMHAINLAISTRVAAKFAQTPESQLPNPQQRKGRNDL